MRESIVGEVAACVDSGAGCGCGGDGGCGGCGGCGGGGVKKGKIKIKCNAHLSTIIAHHKTGKTALKNR